MKKWLCFSVLTSLSICIASASSVSNQGKLGPDLILNGDFENVPPYTEGRDYRIVGPDSSDITGWHVSALNVGVHQGKWKPYSGVRCIDLNGDDAGGVYQRVSTNPGATYQLEFYMAGNIEGRPTEKLLYTRAAGQAAQFAFNCLGRSHSDLGWQHITWQFKADSKSTALEIGSLTKGTHAGALIDSVSLREVVSKQASLAMANRKPIYLSTSGD